MPDEDPYIPLSTIRKMKHKAQELWRCGEIDEQDIWLFILRQEVDRLIIQDLKQQLYQTSREKTV